MPLSDYVNFNPAPEATGGDTSVISGGYYDPQALAALGPANAYSYYNAANTVGITPFEAGQMYQTAFNPQNVYTGSAGVETNPFLGAILQQTSPSTSGLPSNIFQGPLPTIGGAGINALYNLGTAGYNYLTGQGNMPLSSMTGGNLGLSGGDLALSQQGAPSNLSLATGSITMDPAAAAQLAAQQAYASQLLASSGQGSDAIANVVNQQFQPALNAAVANNLNANLGLAPATATEAQNVAQQNVGNVGNVVGLPAYNVSGPASFGSSINVGALGGPTMMGPVYVPGGQTATPASTVSQTTTPPATTTASTDIVQSPKVEVKAAPVTTATPPTGSLATQLLTASGYVYDPATGKYSLPEMKVSDTKATTPPVAGPQNIFSAIKPPTEPVGPFAPTQKPSTSTSTTTQTTATTSTNVPTTTAGDVGGGITYNPSAGQVAAGATDRNLARELAQTIPALYGQYNFGGKQGTLMDQYTGMYQNLLGQTMLGNAQTPGLTSQIAQQLAADQAKLQRIQSGQLAAEDVRNAQQAAREAYGARGQVMGQGAIGAEILNREAIRQQREDQARAAYQASMQNAFNATQLQTGNIFSPIGQLVSGTFNPLGAYPQDVYSSNVNAQLARDIAAANNAAAIEAAKYGATQAKQAATTSAIGNVLGKLIGLG